MSPLNVVTSLVTLALVVAVSTTDMLVVATVIIMVMTVMGDCGDDNDHDGGC